MKLLTLITFLIILFQSNSKDELIWNKNKQLTWSDFKGNYNNNEPYSARSCVGIRKTFTAKDNDLYFSVTAKFYSQKAWVKPDKQTETLLKHEQGHFDIRELFARKLRQQLSNTTFIKSDLKNVISVIYKNNSIEELKYDSLYDAETNHSKIEDKQKEWEDKIAYGLEYLKNYSDTIVMKKIINK